MKLPNAYGVYQEFAPAPAGPFQMDRHYLLYASKGAMRLTSQNKTWSLPPARAALIEANRTIMVALPQKMTICSALFLTKSYPQPPMPLSVFEMTPLAKELVLECGKYGPESAPHDEHVQSLFVALASVCWRLAQQPSLVSMPTGQSEPVIKALELTEADLQGDPNFQEIADLSAMTTRSLARRFSQELGMTWQQALRKMRMVRAIEELAASDASVTNIAFAVGYNSLSAFNAAFREFTGKTPTEYRQSFRS